NHTHGSRVGGTTSDKFPERNTTRVQVNAFASATVILQDIVHWIVYQRTQSIRSSLDHRWRDIPVYHLTVVDFTNIHVEFGHWLAKGHGIIDRRIVGLCLLDDVVHIAISGPCSPAIIG